MSNIPKIDNKQSIIFLFSFSALTRLKLQTVQVTITL